MFIKLQFNRAGFSSWMLFTFVLALLVSAFISEFFQAPTDQIHELNSYRTLIKKEDLTSIKEIKLTNRLGQFHFNLASSSFGDSWTLNSPRKLPARDEAIQSMLNHLSGLKIRRIFTKDPINISNFSLDSPLMEITLSKNDTVTHLKFGLVNPIDNSTYVMDTDQEAIYHVDALKGSMETHDLSYFVDGRILHFDPKEIKSIKVYRGSPSLSSLRSQITLKNGKWTGKRDQEYEEVAVKDYFQSLTSLKSTFILDERSEELNKQIDRYLSRPYYTVLIKGPGNTEVTMKVSSIVGKLSGVKVEKRQFVLIKASNRDHPYLVGKDLLSIFRPDERKLKKLPFKKLFY